MKDGGFGRSPLFPKAYALGNFYINLQNHIQTQIITI